MDRPDVSLERMRTFARVAQRGSLSAVARELGVGQSTVSRHLRELEEAVGVPLLSRTTRRVTLTEEGARYLANCLRILRLVDQAGEEARATKGGPAGTVRISCTAAFGVLHLTRLVFDCLDRYPDIGIDLSLTDKRIDLAREGIDIAVRLGTLPDSALKLRPLGWSRRMMVAAPEYLAARGSPRHPDELPAHDGVRVFNVAGSEMLELHGPAGERYEGVMGGRFRVDHGLAAREALVAGRGICAAHLWLVDDLLADGRVVPVLPDYVPAPIPFNMLIAPERAGIRRVRMVVEALAEAITRLPGIGPET